MISRTVLTSVGHVTLGRRYYACTDPACRAKATPLDDWAGLGARSLTPHARRMVSLAGTSWPFDTAAARLKDLCHVTVSDDTIERVCQEEGEAARAWLDGPSGGADAAVAAFAAAPGRPEFYTDGLKVNTVDGWREMRLSVFAKREAAAPSTPDRWRERVLPGPAARLACCAIAPSNVVGASWARRAARLGLADSADLSAGGDGARWIWDEVAKRLSPAARWFVDVYHVGQRLHACAREMLGDGDGDGDGPAARAWGDRQLDRLVELQGPRYVAELDAAIAAAAAAAAAGADDAPAAAALGRLRSYLADNRDALWYADRLAAGLPIGSGLIEGACKTMQARLRVNSPRWRVRRVERIGALKCLDYSDQWEAFWQDRAA